MVSTLIDDGNSNPKQAEADTKVPLHLVPPVAMIHMAAVLREGANKPGRWWFNWRDNGVKLSAYLSAQARHAALLHDGEWIDEESGCPHAACMMANEAIILDAYHAGKLVDDLPKVKTGVKHVLEAYHQKWKAEKLGTLPAPPPAIEYLEAVFEDGKDCGDTYCEEPDCVYNRARLRWLEEQRASRS